MEVKFVTSAINVGKKKNFEEFISGIRNKKLTKQASADTTKNIKVAEEACDDVDEKEDEDEECKPCEDAATQSDSEVVAESTENVEKEAKIDIEEEDTKEADASEETAKTKEAKVEKEEIKEASTSRFIKLSKLNGETREMLRKYWGNLYPAEYVDAMLAEK